MRPSHPSHIAVSPCPCHRSGRGRKPPSGLSPRRPCGPSFCPVGAVVVLGHVVAVVVVRRARPAAAAMLLVVALAAVARRKPACAGARTRGSSPSTVEGLLAHVAGVLGHVRARAHDALAADDAVGEAGQAAARVASGDTELLGDARELRRAGGLDVDVDLSRPCA